MAGWQEDGPKAFGHEAMGTHVLNPCGNPKAQQVLLRLTVTTRRNLYALTFPGVPESGLLNLVWDSASVFAVVLYQFYPTSQTGLSWMFQAGLLAQVGLAAIAILLRMRAVPKEDFRSHARWRFQLVCDLCVVAQVRIDWPQELG